MSLISERLKMSEKKIVLRNQFSGNIESYVSESGDGLEIKWEYITDEKGNRIRKASGKVNVYEQIQAALPSTDIHSILIRVANGEANLLNVPNLGFIDTSELPLDENQRIEMVSKAKESFEKLDPSIKAAFGNSFSKFYKAVADGVAESAIADALKKAEEVVKKEEVVKTEEGEK